MLNSAKNILRLKPWYAVLYVAVLGVLLLSTYLEYKSRYRDLLQLIQDQAAMTAAVIAQSGSGQAYLTEELKQSYIDHAIDILTILNQMDSEQALEESNFNELINDQSILKVTAYDASGKIERASSKRTSRDQPETTIRDNWVQEKLKPIIARIDDLLIVGVDQEARTIGSGEEQFLIAIPRDRGGALACELSVEAEADFKYLTAMESALEDLLRVKGLQYLQLALDNHDPYFVSKDGLVIDDSWTRTSIANILYQLDKGDTSLIEVVRPVFFGTNLGEVRIGFEDDTLLDLRGAIIYQILIRTTLLTLLAFAILIFLVSRQNEALLEREKKRIEQEVYHLEKLNRLREKQAAVGELAAGVAHEIRNPLNAIGIVAQRLKREFEPSTEVDEYLSLTGTMVTEIGRINNSLQEFLEYTRPTPLNFIQLDASELMQKIQELYLSQAREKKIQITVETDSIFFQGDSEYLQQVFSNLVKNALDACSAGDVVTLSARVEKDSIIFTVKDTGTGISTDQLSRIFDLYFTTKDMGTGVGLALTHKIIADHQGSIDVESEVGTGTTFGIKLPVEP